MQWLREDIEGGGCLWMTSDENLGQDVRSTIDSRGILVDDDGLGDSRQAWMGWISERSRDYGLIVDRQLASLFLSKCGMDGHKLDASVRLASLYFGDSRITYEEAYHFLEESSSTPSLVYRFVFFREPQILEVVDSETTESSLLGVLSMIFNSILNGIVIQGMFREKCTEEEVCELLGWTRHTVREAKVELQRISTKDLHQQANRLSLLEVRYKSGLESDLRSGLLSVLGSYCGN